MVPYCYLFLLSVFILWLLVLAVPQYFYTDRSKAVLLLWILTVTCSCCPYLYFGSAIMLVTRFTKGEIGPVAEIYDFFDML